MVKLQLALIILQEVISLCENRCMLFDNKTKDEKKRNGQVYKLLSLIDMVISQNDGRPYTDELFTEVTELKVVGFANFIILFL